LYAFLISPTRVTQSYPSSLCLKGCCKSFHGYETVKSALTEKEVHHCSRFIWVSSQHRM
jgi:hypothetical protein